MRSADSWIGVSGFLISCARRRATSPQAASRCACSSVVMSSNTSTTPPARRRLARQRGAGAHEHVPPGLGRQLDLFAPVERPRAEARRDRGEKLGEQRAVADDSSNRLPTAASEVDTEDGARRLIRGAHRQIRLQRDDAGRQPRQDHGQSRPFRLDGLLAAPRLLARPREALGHVVEGGHQETELIARRQRQLGVVVALRHRAGAGDEVLHRLDQPLRGEERAVHRRDQRHQHDERQDQHEGGLERAGAAAPDSRIGCRSAAPCRPAG